MNRKSLREQIFKLLFRLDFIEPSELDAQSGYFFDSGDMTVGPKDRAAIMNKCAGIVEKVPEIDAVLNEKMHGWTTDRISKVELTILRLGTYEILYDESIPAGVAINEAVELAKKFGEDESGAFVNGVLAGVNGRDSGSREPARKNAGRAVIKDTVSEKKGDTYITRKL